MGPLITLLHKHAHKEAETQRNGFVGSLLRRS